MNFIMQMVLRRLKEPSSFAGLGGVLVACGISLPGGDAALQHIITIIGGAAALLSMFMAERGEEKQD